jgi:hypothetical protein
MAANRFLHSVIQYVIFQEAAAQQSERRTAGLAWTWSGGKVFCQSCAVMICLGLDKLQIGSGRPIS